MKAIPLIIVSEDTAAACGWFNTNAFPGELRDLVDACRGRSALLRFFVRNMHREVELALQRFEVEYRRRGVESEQLPADARLVVVFDATGYLACLDGVLYALKSFLDVYAQLMARVIHGNASIGSFSKKKIGSTDLSGGSLIHWLRCSAPRACAEAGKLADVVESHSRHWITEAVTHRDTLTHHGSIKGLVHMQMGIGPQDRRFRVEEVKTPCMPDGTGLAQYAQRLLRNLDCFIKETLVLLPGVDCTKISQKGRPLSGGR